MFSPQVHSSGVDNSQSQASRPMVSAIIIGLVLGSLFTLLWNNLSSLETLALWPLAFALGFLSTGLFWGRKYGQKMWGMMIGGQFLGVIATGLLFISTLT